MVHPAPKTAAITVKGVSIDAWQDARRAAKQSGKLMGVWLTEAMINTAIALEVADQDVQLHATDVKVLTPQPIFVDYAAVTLVVTATAGSGQTEPAVMRRPDGDRPKDLTNEPTVLASADALVAPGLSQVRSAMIPNSGTPHTQTRSLKVDSAAGTKHTNVTHCNLRPARLFPGSHKDAPSVRRTTLASGRRSQVVDSPALRQLLGRTAPVAQVKPACLHWFDRLRDFFRGSKPKRALTRCVTKKHAPKC